MIESNEIVVYDLEYTSWEGSLERDWSHPHEEREVVQIGAVKLDSRQGLKEIDTLDLLVRPRLNPILSDYFIRLTGITQQALEIRGMDFADALVQFSQFVGTAGYACSNGHDVEILCENCSLYAIGFPLDKSRFRDISVHLSREAGRSSHVTSSNLDEAFGIRLDLPSHDALGDARNIAGVLRHLSESGHKLIS